MTDFGIFYKEKSSISELGDGPMYDLFISAYRPSERVQRVFERVQASRKVWVCLPEYGTASTPPNSTETFMSNTPDEAEFFAKLRAHLAIADWSSVSLCVDITGFIGHYVVYATRFFQYLDLRRFDVIYCEPTTYVNREQTKFSDELVLEIRQIPGFEGMHEPETDHDLLVIGAGYDDKLIAAVANHKDSAQKVQLFGLPALHPDMFQESVLRAREAGDALGTADDPRTYRFAPASDPFSTAESVAQIVDEHRTRNAKSNVYLSPLGTKAQALGFAIYWLFDGVNAATSVIYPVCRQYASSTEKGIGKVWRYTVEFPPPTATK